MANIAVTIPLINVRTGRDLTRMCERCCTRIRESVNVLRGDSSVPPSTSPLCYRNIPLSELQLGVSTVANLLQQFFLGGDHGLIAPIAIAHPVTIFGIRCNNLGDAYRAAAEMGVILALLRCDASYGPVSQYTFGASMHPKNIISKMSRPELQTICNDGSYVLDCTPEVVAEPFLHGLFRATMGKVYGFLATNSSPVGITDNKLSYPRVGAAEVAFMHAVRGDDTSLRSYRWSFMKLPITYIERDGNKPKPIPWLPEDVKKWDPLYSYVALPHSLIPDFISKYGCCLRYVLPLTPETAKGLSDSEAQTAATQGYISTAALSVMRPCGKYPYVSYDYAEVEASIFAACHDGINTVRGVSYDEVFFKAYSTSLLDMAQSGCNGVAADMDPCSFDVITSRDKEQRAYDIMSYRAAVLAQPSHTFRVFFWGGGDPSCRDAYQIVGSAVATGDQQLIQSRLGLTANLGAQLYRRSYVVSDLEKQYAEQILPGDENHGLVYTTSRGRITAENGANQNPEQGTDHNSEGQ